MLAVVETHPIQYHAPVYRALQSRYGVPVTAVYGSDFSVTPYHDAEFGTALTWDVDLLEGYGYRFLSRAAGGRPDVSQVSATGVSAALRRVKPRATLITGYSPAFHRRAWYAAWRLGQPILFRGETSDLVQSSSVLVRAARDSALRVAYRSCDRVLYIGERARRHYRALGVSDARLVFSPYCVDTTPFRIGEADRANLRDVTRQQLGIGPDQYVILFSGKLSERKGVDLMIEAARRLPPALRGRTVVALLGDGALRDDLGALAAAAPALPLVMLGLRGQREMSAFYHASDLLVLPSRHSETWGLVVNEALHHGVPCVVSDRVGCAPDLINDRTGLVCSAGSVDGLSDAIARAWALVDRADVRERCREQAAAYSVDRAAQGIADAYFAATGQRAAA